MIIIRCTQKLLKLSKIKPEQEISAPDAPLGEWYANVISLTYPGQSAVIYTHNPSRLTVIVKGRSIKTTIEKFEPCLLKLLQRLGADDYLLKTQQVRMREVHIGKTESRSLLGSMNDIVFQIQNEAMRAGRIENLSLDYLENALSTCLFSSKDLGKDYFRPVEYLRGHVFTNRN